MSFHVFVTEPVFEELERILIITQNQDGSWGTSATLDDRFYPTGWAVFALSSINRSSVPENVKLLMKTQIIPQLENAFEVSKWLHAKKLCGLFLLLPYICEEKQWTNRRLFMQNLKNLIEFLENKNWINNQVASYFVFGCSRIQGLEDMVTKAKSFLQKVTTQNFSELVYVSLGYPEVLLSIFRTIESMEKLKIEIEKLTDEQLSHLLLGLSLVKNEEKKDIVAMVKNETITRLRNRQITELDKKVTKEFLDLLLLLKAKIPLEELQKRLRQLNNEIFIQNIESETGSIRITTAIPSGQLQEALGKIDIPTISCYIVSSLNMSEKNVYLLPQRDYAMIEAYFKTKTLPVNQKRLLLYEAKLVLVIVAFEAYFCYLLSRYPIIPQWIGTISFIPILGVSIYFLVFIFPELAHFLISKIPISIRKILKKVPGWGGIIGECE
jgi:hypothetical protein